MIPYTLLKKKQEGIIKYAAIMIVNGIMPIQNFFFKSMIFLK